MAFTNIGDTKYFRYNDCEKGQLLTEGTYVREFQGTYGTQYEFLEENGDIAVLNGAANLAHKLRFADPGNLVRIEYDGKRTITSGSMAGKYTHQFKVAIDKDKSKEGEMGLRPEASVIEEDEFSKDILDSLV